MSINDSRQSQDPGQVEAFRPRYHFTPPSMWLNDPNGMVYHHGEYHLFYQYHPESTVWGPMHWGHAVSRDLIHWEHLPIALYPDEKGMIFSGSAIVDHDNTAGFGKDTLVAIYTSHQDEGESQSIAYSTDLGRTWTKYAGNPVIPHLVPPSDFRDPKVFWHADHWVMALAAGRAICFYISPDLIHWEYSGTFGNGFGSTVGVWETPDLFELPVDDGKESRWVLTIGVGDGAPAGGSGTQYFIGNFDGKMFISENPKDTILWADHGPDYYAPQSWNNEPLGRRLMIGWMSNWQYARSTPTLSWRGTFSIIRQVSLTKTEQGIRLVHIPIPELQALRGEHFHWENVTVRPGSNLLADIRGNALEIKAEFLLDDTTTIFGFRIRMEAGEYTGIYYNPKDGQITVDRSRSGKVDFYESFARAHSADLPPMEGRMRLHIFIDSSSVEIFANNGTINLTELIFPNYNSQGLELFVESENIFLNYMDVYQLHSNDGK